jgi:hypothetical protein
METDDLLRRYSVTSSMLGWVLFTYAKVPRNV